MPIASRIRAYFDPASAYIMQGSRSLPSASTWRRLGRRGVITSSTGYVHLVSDEDAATVTKAELAQWDAEMEERRAVWEAGAEERRGRWEAAIIDTESRFRDLLVGAAGELARTGATTLCADGTTLDARVIRFRRGRGAVLEVHRADGMTRGWLDVADTRNVDRLFHELGHLLADASHRDAPHAEA